MKRTNNKSEPAVEAGRVSTAVAALLRRQVEDRGLAVWYDPQKAYGELVKGLTIADCAILRYADGFFRLREQLEPLLECVTENGTLKPDADVPPRTVVYVPMARADTAFALIEVEAAGTVVEPDAAAPERNSRLGRIVENVFRKIAPAKAEHLARQADEGLLTVEELDRMAGEAGAVAAGALQVVFGSVSAEEMLLQFAAQNGLDDSLRAKSALPELAALIQGELGLAAPDASDCAALRDALQRFLLVSDLLLGVAASDRPEELGGMPLPDSAAQRDMVARLCRQWRNRIDLKDACTEAAERIEADLALAGMQWRTEALGQAQSFPFVERLLLDQAVAGFIDGDGVAEERATERGQGFWARERPVLQLGWRVVESASELAAVAQRVRAMLKAQDWTLDALIEAYALHADPWMRLDRLARDLETRHARWEAAVTDTEPFEPLMARARGIYAETAGALAEAYAGALRGASFKSTRHANHAGLFRRQVLPDPPPEGKTAYLMVDALRYEMAVELIEGLQTEFDEKIEPVIGCLPGITAVGMAALLPGSENGLALDAAAGGIEVRIGETAVSSRTQRLDWFTSRAGVPVCCAKLSDVLKPAFRRRKDFASARLVVVTSQEIDRLGEEGDEEGIRLYLTDVLDKLRRALRLLARAGVKRFVIAADHGFVYAPGIDPGLTMDAPGGKTAGLHPRVWMGQGGSSGDGFFRVRAADLALQGPLELAFPLGLGSFRVRGGAGAYFHGGVSPAEHVLPVVTLVPIAEAGATEESRVRMNLSKSILTNRLFSVSVAAESEGLFGDGELRLRFELVSGRKEAGRAATAAYGFEDGTGEVLLKRSEPNVVTFMLEADPGPTVTIRALDCRTQVVLDTLKDIPVKLGM